MNENTQSPPQPLTGNPSSGEAGSGQSPAAAGPAGTPAQSGSVTSTTSSPKKKSGISPYFLALITFLLGIGLGYVLVKEFPKAQISEKVMNPTPTVTQIPTPTVEPSPASPSAMIEGDLTPSGTITPSISLIKSSPSPLPSGGKSPTPSKQ